jgi:hypothetical protein
LLKIKHRIACDKLLEFTWLRQVPVRLLAPNPARYSRVYPRLTAHPSAALIILRRRKHAKSLNRRLLGRISTSKVTLGLSFHNSSEPATSSRTAGEVLFTARLAIYKSTVLSGAASAHHELHSLGPTSLSYPSSQARNLAP